jgi:hypothetical protein
VLTDMAQAAGVDTSVLQDYRAVLNDAAGWLVRMTLEQGIRSERLKRIARQALSLLAELGIEHPDGADDGPSEEVQRLLALGGDGYDVEAVSRRATQGIGELIRQARDAGKVCDGDEQETEDERRVRLATRLAATGRDTTGKTRPPFDDLVGILAAVFEAATGRRPTFTKPVKSGEKVDLSGKFVSFCLALFKGIGADVPTGWRIEAALERARADKTERSK